MAYNRMQNQNDEQYATALLPGDTDDKQENYIKKYEKRDTTIVAFLCLAFVLGLCSIGISTTSYNKTKKLESEIHSLQDYHSQTSKMLMETSTKHYQHDIKLDIGNMITGHPLCQVNYTECMMLLHIASFVSSNNFTKDDVTNNKFELSTANVMVFNPENEIIAKPDSFSHIYFNATELPPPELCHSYSYGTCIFTRNGKMAFYSHLVFNSDYYNKSMYRRSVDDFFSYGASGAGMGSAIGGGIAVIAGPEAIPVGAAIGGAVGAVVGGAVGAFQ